MIILSITLFLYPVLVINNTMHTLKTSYVNKKFNEEFGLEYFEDIDDIDDLYKGYFHQLSNEEETQEIQETQEKSTSSLESEERFISYSEYK